MYEPKQMHIRLFIPVSKPHTKNSYNGWGVLSPVRDGVSRQLHAAVDLSGKESHTCVAHTCTHSHATNVFFSTFLIMSGTYTVKSCQYLGA
jgi:hypothetical protein